MMSDLYYKAYEALTDYFHQKEEDTLEEARDNAEHSLMYFAPTGQENIAHMREVLKFAEQEAALKDSRFDMGDWCAGTVSYGEQPECGTTMCLAGTASWMSLAPGERMRGASILKGDVNIASASRRGADYLGLSGDQDEIFYLTEAGPDTIRPVMEYMAGEAL